MITSLSKRGTSDLQDEIKYRMCYNLRIGYIKDNRMICFVHQQRLG